MAAIPISAMPQAKPDGEHWRVQTPLLLAVLVPEIVARQ